MYRDQVSILHKRQEYSRGKELVFRETQMLVSGVDYCEFIVQTEQYLFVQRITLHGIVAIDSPEIRCLSISTSVIK